MKPSNQLKTLFKNSTLYEVISELTRGSIGCCLIKERSKENKLLGLITDGDLLRSLKSSDSDIWDKLKAKDIMTKDPIIISHDLLSL